MDEKKFDGMLLSYCWEKHGIGSVVGIATRELRFGPDSLRINIAHPKEESLSSIGLFWLEGCADRGQYCQRACYYWLLPEFSKVRELRSVVARVKPSIEKTVGVYDFILWANGEPVPLGHQFTAGQNFSGRLRNGLSLSEVIRAWELGEVDTDFNKTVKETNSVISQVTGDEYVMRLNSIRDEFSMKPREAIWEAKRGLLIEVV